MVVAGSRRRRGRRACRDARSSAGCASSTAVSALRRAACGAPGRAGRRLRAAIRRSLRISSARLGRPRAVIPSGRCGGRQRARPSSPTGCVGWGIEIVDRSVLRLLGRMGYTMQANVKTREGAEHPDRDAQFEHINDTVAAALAAERAGDQRRHQEEGAGRRFQERRARVGAQRASPSRSTRTTSRATRRARRSPTGSMTWRATTAGSRSASAATPPSSRPRRSAPGGSSSARSATPTPRSLTITADSGGSNSARGRLWKTELQKLADKIGIAIRVLHFPPGTSKWNKIEHRLFSFISDQLARQAADRLRSDHQPDRRHDHQHRPEGLRPPRRDRLPQGHQGQRRRAGRGQHPAPRVPRRLELHHPPCDTNKVVSPKDD